MNKLDQIKSSLRAAHHDYRDLRVRLSSQQPTKNMEWDYETSVRTEGALNNWLDKVFAEEPGKTFYLDVFDANQQCWVSSGMYVRANGFERATKRIFAISQCYGLRTKH